MISFPTCVRAVVCLSSHHFAGVCLVRLSGAGTFGSQCCVRFEPCVLGMRWQGYQHASWARWLVAKSASACCLPSGMAGSVWWSCVTKSICVTFALRAFKSLLHPFRIHFKPFQIPLKARSKPCECFSNLFQIPFKSFHSGLAACGHAAAMDVQCAALPPDVALMA